ncbi:MAG: GDYXXLXY domain-containing protein [Planctomycetota bacterium]
MKLGVKYLLAVAAQIAVLLFLVVQSEWALRHGQRVLLEVVSHEDLHPLTGRARELHVAVAELDKDLQHDPDWEPTPREAVYVLLREGPGGHFPAGYTNRRPAGGLFLRGRITSVTPERITVDYGLDRFYVPSAATGDFPDCKLAVRVTADGTALIEDLLVDGQPYADWKRPGRIR